MKIKSTLSISEARTNIFKIANEAQKTGNYFTLTERGHPKVILISAEEFESIMETMEIVSNPTILEKINKAEEEYKKGEFYTFEDVVSQLQVNDLTAKKIGVNSKRKT